MSIPGNGTTVVPKLVLSTEPASFCWRLTGGPLPPVLITLSLGEVARRAALACLGGPQRELLPALLAGHAKMTSQTHQHPFFLPVDSDGDGFIDQVVAYFPAGLDADRQTLLHARMQRLWLPDGKFWDLVPTIRPNFTQTSLVWQSTTPYVLTRYPKLHHDGRPKLNDRGEQRDGPEDQVRREWERFQQDRPALPVLQRVELVPDLTLADGSTVCWREFDCLRQNGHSATSGMSFGLRLQFAVPIVGPLALGSAAHFGLGQFWPNQRVP